MDSDLCLHTTRRPQEQVAGLLGHRGQRLPEELAPLDDRILGQDDSDRRESPDRVHQEKVSGPRCFAQPGHGLRLDVPQFCDGVYLDVGACHVCKWGHFII